MMPVGRKGAPVRAVGRGQERVGSNPYEEKKTTRKKVEGYTILQRELRSNNPQFSHMPMSDMALIRAAREEWNRLSPQVRERYEILAKQENAKILEKHGSTWQRDMFGRSILSEEQKNQERIRWVKKTEEHMRKMVKCSREEIINKEFHIISVNTFLNTGSHKRPEDVHVILAEVTLLRFNIKDGRIGMTTFFPAQGEIPCGHMADMMDSTEDHGIPLEPRQAYTVSDARDVAAKMRKFVVGLDEGPVPLFTRESDITKVRLGLVHIYEQIDSPCPWNDSEDHGWIYPLEKLTATLTNRGIEIGGGNPDHQMNVAVASQYWSDQPTLLVGKQCCTFHGFIDKTLQCSQAQAMSCLWWTLGYCVGKYDVNVTENHFPREIQEKQRRLAKNSAMSEWAVGGACDFSAESTDATKRGLGRGVTLEEPQVQKITRGRGRCMKGRLPTYLE